ncbi:MAG: ABC transporter ATP-binding protein [Spirochaetales bacterium]|nr:ABC transporter ATP-binding protein [Spirochaetales bacterium]
MKDVVTNIKNPLLHHLFASKTKVVIASLCSLLNKLFDLAPPFLIGTAVDIAVRQNDSFLGALGIGDAPTQYVVLGIATFIIWVLESVFEYLYKITWQNLAQRIQHDIRKEAYEHIQTLEIAYFEDRQTGGIMSILNNDINQLERFLNSGISEMIQLVLTIVVISTAFFMLSPQIAWMAMLPIPFLIIFSIKYQGFLKPKYQDVREKVGLMNGILSNNLTGIATIKSYVAETYESKRVSFISKEYVKANEKAILYSAGFVPLIRMFIVVGFTLMLVYGGLRTLSGNLEIAAYSAMVFLTQRLLWPLTGLGNTLDLFQRSMASTKRIQSLLGRQSKTVSGKKRLAVKDVQGEIEFHHISFSYENRETIFTDFNTIVHPGQSIAFVGTTGAGKSTIVKLLLRFYDPDKGKITLDGIDTKDLDINDLRTSIGLVNQDTFIIDGTILENIAYARPDTEMEAVIEAAKIAEIHDFILTLPDQYNTLVGERGQKLSGGQKQRLAIARAVLKNPPILILDEATSSVDNETEAAIQRSLEKIIKGRTTIIIAHRLSTVRNADHIFIIGDGGIIEQGTHDNLVLKEGLYANLWKVQTGKKD